MLMLSKHTGFVVFGFYSLLLLWFFWKNRQNFRVLLWVLGAAVLTYSPYLIWALYHKIEILGFVSVFLGITEKPEWSASALKVFQRYDSGIVEFLNLYYKSHGLLLIVLLIFPVYYFVRIRFKDEPQNIVLLLFLFLVLVAGIALLTAACSGDGSMVNSDKGRVQIALPKVISHLDPVREQLQKRPVCGQDDGLALS